MTTSYSIPSFETFQEKWITFTTITWSNSHYTLWPIGLEYTVLIYVVNSETYRTSVSIKFFFFFERNDWITVGFIHFNGHVNTVIHIIVTVIHLNCSLLVLDFVDLYSMIKPLYCTRDKYYTLNTCTVLDQSRWIELSCFYPVSSRTYLKLATPSWSIKIGDEYVTIHTSPPPQS